MNNKNYSNKLTIRTAKSCGFKCDVLESEVQRKTMFTKMDLICNEKTGKSEHVESKIMAEDICMILKTGLWNLEHQIKKEFDL